MKTQNFNTFKNKISNTQSQITIYQLPDLHPIPYPPFNTQASKPLNLNFYQLKQKFQQSISHRNIPHTQNNKIYLQNQVKPQQYDTVQQLRKQNNNLKKDIQQLTKLYQQQKLKYHQLKTLYKEGQIMFQMLEQKKIFMEKQNKELKIILQNLYNQLHHQNQSLTHAISIDKQSNQKKIKIGNKKIPVIKVNVPAQTFMKKQHQNSVFSINSQLDSIQKYKEQIIMLKQQIQRLTLSNKQLKQQLTKIKNQHHENLTNNMDIKVNSLLNQNYEQAQSSINYFRNKYVILQTQSKKKDDMLRDLSYQCYLLQKQINELKNELNNYKQNKNISVNNNLNIQNQYYKRTQ